MGESGDTGQAREAGFQVLEHPADIGLGFWGPTMDAAFVQAALGLGHLLSEDAVTPSEVVALSVTGSDRLELLYNWLSELLYYFDAKALVFREVEIQALSETRLAAVARGGCPSGETPYYVKAITYHQMALEQGEKGWHGRVFVDI